MPTARYGDCRSQASIAVWVGARHWSKPKPWKAPGVATLAGAESAGAAAPTVATVVPPSRVRAVAASSGRSSIGSPGSVVGVPVVGARPTHRLHGDATP